MDKELARFKLLVRADQRSVDTDKKLFGELQKDQIELERLLKKAKRTMRDEDVTAAELAAKVLSEKLGKYVLSFDNTCQKVGYTNNVTSSLTEDP